eukprot:4327317-Prymnesium_polylepis.1
MVCTFSGGEYVASFSARASAMTVLCTEDAEDPVSDKSTTAMVVWMTVSACSPKGNVECGATSMLYCEVGCLLGNSSQHAAYVVAAGV